MKAISCEFNMDTACVELRLDDGTLIAIDTIAVENQVAGNVYERSELDYLIYSGRQCFLWGEGSPTGIISPQVFLRLLLTYSMEADAVQFFAVHVYGGY